MMGGRRTGALVGGLMLAVWLGFGSPTQVQACEGAQVANAAGAAFLAAAEQGSVGAFSQALSSYADMDKITIFALGRYQNQLHPNRRAELTSLTSRYVSTTLADFAKKFKGTSIEAIQCRPGEVISRFNRGARGAERIVWRVSGNKVTDVHVQNVWLGQLLRDNFASVIQRGGGSIDALFRHLGAKTSAELGK